MIQKIIEYAKEFFINEQGEVIKMAAVVSRDQQVLDQLNSDPSYNRDSNDQNGKKQKQKRKQKREKILFRNNFITVLKVKNTLSEKVEPGQEPNEICQFKVLLFHCKDKEHQQLMVQNTQYCYVGNYLCYRHRDERTIWVTKIKSKEKPIPYKDINNLYAYDDAEKSDLNKELGIDNRLVTAIRSKPLNINTLAGQMGDIEHIQLTEVPKAYFTTIKSREMEGMKFFNNVLQVTVRCNGMIYDLDSLMEVDSLESIDQF